MTTNLGNKLSILPEEQQVANASARPLVIAESNITHAQVFHIKSNANQVYEKRNLNAWDTTLID